MILYVMIKNLYWGYFTEPQCSFNLNYTGVGDIILFYEKRESITLN